MRRNVFTTYDPNLPSGKKFVAVHVQNEDPLYFLVEVKSKVCELFTQITKFLNLLEPELFGLAVKNADTSYIFMDPLEKLCKYAPKHWRTQNNGMDNDGQPLFNVHFRVQFYVESYLFISDKTAKLLYYHQMRENVLLYDQSMCEERAFLLASYALQADFGNYNSQLHKDRYFEPRFYFPSWVIEELGVDYIVRHLPVLHRDHRGLSKSEAQSMYIKEASDSIAPHNFHLYKLSCKKGANTWENVWLAITISGIAIYSREIFSNQTLNVNITTNSSSSSSSGTVQTSTRPSAQLLKSRISFFPWSDIGKLSFEKKKFEIRSTGSQGRKFVYYATSEEMARHLLWFSRASHQFHLMVATKMKEMLKREAEINRRKYRESCISSTSSANSSSGNSSAGSSSVTNPSSLNTSKSASPFEYSASSSSNGSGKGSPSKKDIISNLDISNLSVCGDHNDDDDHSATIDQRVSVISNASSNTTSGIDSDKVHGLEDSDRDDIDSDPLMSLNHHHHHHHLHHHHLNHHRGVNRTVTLSGCSQQPVVSLESLALSEPTEHRSCHRVSDGHHHPSKMANNLAVNKKHSISISNIMITSSNSTTSNSTTSGTSSSHESTSASSDIFSSASSPCDATNREEDGENADNETVSYAPATEVLITGDHCSKVLCFDINQPSPSQCCSLSPYEQLCSDEDSSLYDEVDSVFDNTSKSYTSGKSSVTVLSTILKPEAERLLKQGIEADDAELMIDDGIDLAELAELKEIEQAEKEKIILNSLINPQLPSPRNDSDDEEDELNDHHHHRINNGHRHCYSPLSQERKLHKLHNNSSPKDANSKLCNKFFNGNGMNALRNGIAHRSPPKTTPKPITGTHKEPTRKQQQPMPLSSNNNNNNHQTRANNTKPENIYENLKNEPTSQVNGNVCRSMQVEALVTPVKTTPHHRLPPLVPLRQAPSMGAFPIPGLTPPCSAITTPTTVTTTTPYQHRTGMRIGVSSLSRPYSANRSKLTSLLNNGCYHHYPRNAAMATTPNGVGSGLGGGSGGSSCCSGNGNLCDWSNLSAGSEPNLYLQANYCWPGNIAAAAGIRELSCNKSDSVFDCRMPTTTITTTTSNSIQQLNSSSSGGVGGHKNENETPKEKEEEKEMSTTTTLTSNSTKPNPQYNNNTANAATVSQDNNNNIEKIIYNSQPNSEVCTLSPLESSTKNERNTSHTPNTKETNSNEDSISDLHQLRQRSSDLNLPLITALFNDSSLMDQIKANESLDDSSSKTISQSLQHIPQNVTNSNCHGNGGGSVANSVERTNTFRVDEAIAKSSLRQQHQQQQQQQMATTVVNNGMVNDDNNNRSDYATPTTTIGRLSGNSGRDGGGGGGGGVHRPISWHLDNGSNSCSSYNRLFLNNPISSSSSSSSSQHHQSTMRPYLATHYPTKPVVVTNSGQKMYWNDHQLTT